MTYTPEQLARHLTDVTESVGIDTAREGIRIWLASLTTESIAPVWTMVSDVLHNSVEDALAIRLEPMRDED